MKPKALSNALSLMQQLKHNKNMQPFKHNKHMQPSKLLLYAAGVIACASLPFTASAAEETAPDESSERPLYRPLTLGLEGGTTGLGGFVSWRFANHWGARAGFDYLELTQHGGTEGGDLHYNATERLMSEPLTLDIYPWKKHSFHVSVGVLFNQNQLTGSSSDTGVAVIDGLAFRTERVGTINLKVEQQLVNPYLGIGGNLFYFDHAHHWAVAGELGVAYTGDAQVTLTRSGSFAPVIDASLRGE